MQDKELRILICDPFDFQEKFNPERLGLIAIRFADGLLKGEPIRIIDEFAEDIVDFVTTKSGTIMMFALTEEQYEWFIKNNFGMKTTHCSIFSQEICCGQMSCLLRQYEKFLKFIKFYQKDKELLWQFSQ